MLIIFCFRQEVEYVIECRKNLYEGAFVTRYRKDVYSKELQEFFLERVSGISVFVNGRY